MSISNYIEDSNYHTFVLSDGTIFNIGKQSESNPNGAANYEQAIEILQMNFPDLIL